MEDDKPAPAAGMSVAEARYCVMGQRCKKGATPTEVSILAGSRGGSGAPESKKFDPVEEVRKQYSGRLKEGDVVLEGYQDMPPERRFVQVVRKGKVVAMFWYDKSGNYIGHLHCKGQF